MPSLAVEAALIACRSLCKIAHSCEAAHDFSQNRRCDLSGRAIAA